MNDWILDELCANCGTVLSWWIKDGRHKVYLNDANECFCSKKCFREYCEPTLADLRFITKNDI